MTTRHRRLPPSSPHRPRGVEPLPNRLAAVKKKKYRERLTKVNTNTHACQGGQWWPGAFGRRRALLFEKEFQGTFSAKPNYCDKADFYRGEHAHCLQEVTSVYPSDVLMLHGGLPDDL